MNKTKIYVDMDGTIAKWQEDKCIEEVMASGYFRDLPPMENVILAIKELSQRTDIEIFILSCVYI